MEIFLVCYMKNWKYLQKTQDQITLACCQKSCATIFPISWYLPIFQFRQSGLNWRCLQYVSTYHKYFSDLFLRKPCSWNTEFLIFNEFHSAFCLLFHQPNWANQLRWVKTFEDCIKILSSADYLHRVSDYKIRSGAEILGKFK